MKTARATKPAVVAKQQAAQGRHAIFLTIIGELAPLTSAQLLAVASEADVSPHCLISWRAGKTTSPGLSRLARVASALGFKLKLEQVTNFRRLYLLRNGV